MDLKKGGTMVRQFQVFLGLSLLFLTSVQAYDFGSCNEWIKKRGISCLFNHRHSILWARECDDFRDLERVCMDQDPNYLKGPCSPWEQVRGIACLKNGRFSKKWVRSCTVSYENENACQDQCPPDF